MEKSWITELYEETFKFWQTNQAKLPAGYAIFYSPVLDCPEIMIIGHNPGGDNRSINYKVMNGPPGEHEYDQKNYALARNMRRIFHYASLDNELRKSVKLNLVFFRSRKAADLDMGELRKFCNPKVELIIEQLQPKLIVTEGFQTFYAVLGLLRGQEQQPVLQSKTVIVRLGSSQRGKILGLRHPSGSRGLSDAMFRGLGDEIKNQVLGI
jgi:hypothetical protein